MATPAFDWDSFLTLANQVSSHTDEASHRTSISRAYYFAYHAAFERAVATGYIDEKVTGSSGSCIDKTATSRAGGSQTLAIE